MRTLFFTNLPNVKDEPRRELARRVPHSELDSDPSFRLSFGRTRRDSSRRWLWRLVGRFLNVRGDIDALDNCDQEKAVERNSQPSHLWSVKEEIKAYAKERQTESSEQE